MALLFLERAFQAFEHDQLDLVMDDFRRYVQPPLRKYGQYIKQLMGQQFTSLDLPVHLAKHIRRKVSLPFNTWVAIGGDNRGYKKYLHLQLGINRQYVFFVIASLDHPPIEKMAIQHWQRYPQVLKHLPEDVVFIFDHTQYDYCLLKEIPLKDIFARVDQKKKADIMIGRILHRNDESLQSEEAFKAWLNQTLGDLRPLLALMVQSGAMTKMKES